MGIKPKNAPAASRRASKPTPAPESSPAAPQSAPADDPASRLTWEDIQTAFGDATDADRRAYKITAPLSKLRDLGAHISSERVLTDARRWLGQIVLHQRRRGALPLGVGAGLLRVACAEAIKLRTMADEFDTGTRQSQTRLATDAGRAKRLYDDGQVAREQWHVALRGLLAHDGSGTLAAKLEAAYATANDHPSLAKSLGSMASLAREIVTGRDASLSHQLREGGVTDERIAQLAALAADVRTAGEALKGGVATEPVTQPALDLQDATCLTHMERLMEAFGAAHAVDATYPLLVPIATRSVFARPHHRAKTPPQAPPSGGAT